MNTIAFMTANYVARTLDYHMTEGWMQGEGATQAYFRPLETFRERFDILLADIRALDFEALDLWTRTCTPLGPPHSTSLLPARCWINMA
jgi:hypothetical protein